MTYQLYIGSDNRTKRLQIAKIKRILATRHEGFTILPVTGFWQGHQENSLMVIVSDNADKVKQTISILKDELHQDAIGYQVVPEMQFA